MNQLTHLNEQGDARMVDVGEKPATSRRATASARLKLLPETVALLKSDGLPKGDALAVARIAGIQAAKRTSELIPLCHPLAITHAEVAIDLEEAAAILRATVATSGPTGVEMEALTAVSVAALALYDMVKAVDRGAVIEQVQLEEKVGGKSGHWHRQ